MSFENHTTSYRVRVSYSLLFLALVVPLLIFLYWQYVLPLGLVDDAYIPMVYANNVVNGYGIVFMPGGERVEGFTSPIWTFLLTVANVLQLSLPFLAYWMGMVCGVLALFGSVMLYRAAFSVQETPTFWSQYFFPSLAGLLIAADISYASWSASGMETLGYTLLLVWIVHLTIAPSDLRFVAIVQLLLALVRPEGIAFMPLTFLFLLRTRAKAAQCFHILFLYCILPYAGFLLFRYAYFGYWLPNTFYAKHDFGGLAVLWRGWIYVKTFFAPRVLLLLSILWLAIEPAYKKWRAAPVFVFAVVQIGLVMLEGGDHFALHRFLVPAIPLLTILSIRTIECIFYRMLLNKIRRKSGMYLFVMQASVSVVLLLVVTGHAMQLYEYKGNDSYGFSHGAIWHQSEVEWARNWADMGRWLNEKYPPDTKIAVITAGAIPFYSQLPCIDILGLNDTHIAHELAGDPNRQYTGHEKSDADYVLAQEPQMIQLFPLLFFGSQPFPEERLTEMLTYPAQHDLWNHPGFHSEYEFRTEDTQYGVISFFERKSAEPDDGSE